MKFERKDAKAQGRKGVLSLFEELPNEFWPIIWTFAPLRPRAFAFKKDAGKMSRMNFALPGFHDHQKHTRSGN